MRFFTDIIKARTSILGLARREIQQQYVGSAMGFIWQFITPLTLIAVFWVVFSVGFRVQPASGVPFVTWLTAGMAAWFVFSEILSASVHGITGNAHLVKKVVFPVQAMPIIKSIAATSNHLVFLVILLVLMVFSKVTFSLMALQAIYYFICLLVLAIGLSWIVSALNVFSRDVARLVGVVLQIGMWATPVLWDIKMLPSPYREIFALNPMHYIAQGYRDSFLYAHPVTQRPEETVIFWCITVFIFLLGMYVFKKLRPQFADLV